MRSGVVTEHKLLPVRLTSASVVMKKEKVTITLAEEGGITNILIKQAP